MSTNRRSFIHRANELFYDPDLDIGEVTAEDREFCLGLLKKFNFSCVAGCAGSSNATVHELAVEAVSDSVGLATGPNTDHMVTGPHPEIETGIGIWTVQK